MKIKILILLAFLAVGCSALKTPMKPSVVGINPDGDVNAVKVNELSGIKASLDKLEKIALVDKSSSENVGGNKTTTNDSDLMKLIFEKWAYILGSLLTFLGMFFASVWKLITMIIKAKDQQIDILVKNAQSQEERLDVWQNQLIDRLVNGKKKESEKT